MARRRKTAPPPAAPQPIEGRQLLDVPLDQIQPSPVQPREDFDPHALNGLAASIQETGVIQPVILEDAGNGQYILQAGERRVRAARIAGLTTIPAVVGPHLNGGGTEERLVRALTENLQRADMNPLEEARGYQALLDLGYTQNAIALKLGVSGARVAGRLRWLTLEPEIQNLVASGRISKNEQVSEALAGVPDPTARVRLARKMAEHNMTIKQSIEAARRVTRVLSEGVMPPGQTPALELARTKAVKAFSRPRWDAIAQVGKVPPWPLVEIAARDTCKKCALRDAASATVCNSCPLVDMLAEMIGRA